MRMKGKKSFHSDDSNMDASQSDCPKPKKKRRVPPPNPPYRARMRGRYSMLIGLFKNTEETPVVLDEAGNDVTLKIVKRNTGEGKSSQRSQKNKQPVEDKQSQSQRKPGQKSMSTENKDGAVKLSSDTILGEERLIQSQEKRKTRQKSVSSKGNVAAQKVGEERLIQSQEKRKTRQKSVSGEGNIGAEKVGEDKFTQSQNKKNKKGEVNLSQRMSQRNREKSNEDKGSQR